MLRFILFAILIGAIPASAQTFGGKVRVIDADTIRVGTVKVRLHGIDAPEIRQPCELADGRSWACGRWASEQVTVLYEGAWARCERRDTDRYGRTVAVCRVDGVDIGARLVREGIAEAYRKYSLDYVDAEKAAFFEGAGLWRGRVQAPANFRHASLTIDPAPAQGCNIKGNISGSGQIYHVPGQTFYAKTRISASRGERWFCTESEALAAGWRRARR